MTFAIAESGWIPEGGYTLPSGALVQIKHQPTPNRQRGKFKDNRPLGIIEHYTAHRNAHGSAAWLADRRARASAHAVLGDRDEHALIQQASFLDRTWHAGDGRWKGMNPNDHFIGLEHSCAGLLKRVGNVWKTWYGETVPWEEVVIGPDHNGVEQRWDDYDQFTLELSIQLHLALADWFRENRREFISALGHSDVAPKRKWDPGPHFPMAQVRSIMGERDTPLVSADPNKPEWADMLPDGVWDVLEGLGLGR